MTIAEKWAHESEQRGLTSVYDPQRHGNPIVYHGLKQGYAREGYLFVTRDPQGAAFHGTVQSFAIKRGAKIHADLENGTAKTGEQTLLLATVGDSSGIIHWSDLTWREVE
jgi:hypothetical protein